MQHQDKLVRNLATKSDEEKVVDLRVLAGRWATRDERLQGARLLSCPQPSGETPLFHCLLHRQPKSLKMLLDMGVDVNVSSIGVSYGREQMYPVEYLVKMWRWAPNKTDLNLLLAAGAYPLLRIRPCAPHDWDWDMDQQMEAVRQWHRWHGRRSRRRWVTLDMTMVPFVRVKESKRLRRERLRRSQPGVMLS
jgi:hypothetical protein